MSPSSEQGLVEFLVEYFMERQQQGESPSIEEYRAKQPDLADEIREVFEALMMVEARAARLHHTNIVPVFEVGAEEDLCFYAMQLIQAMIRRNTYGLDHRANGTRDVLVEARLRDSFSLANVIV